MPDAARMRTLAALTIRAQDDERARVARELHDSSAQSVAALVYQLAAAARDCTDPAITQRLHAMREQAGSILEELRSMAHAMHPYVLDDLGLEAALEWLVRKAEEHSGLHVQLETMGGDRARELSRESAAALYRVAQESIRNVERHAAASSVRLALVGRRHYVSLDVLDDGRGFDVEEASARRPGMGLFAMRERLGLVNGLLEIESTPGAGTRIHASVPTGNDLPAYLPLVS